MWVGICIFNGGVLSFLMRENLSIFLFACGWQAESIQMIPLRFSVFVFENSLVPTSNFPILFLYDLL